MQPRNVPKTVKNRVKNDSKSIKNLSEIDAVMTGGSKIAFLKHLGHLGGQLGAILGSGYRECANMLVRN